MEHQRRMHGERNHAPRKERSLAEISVTVWLTPENAAFYEKNGFLYIKHEEKEQRVFLCRQFPFVYLWEFISVLDEEQCEIGIIRDLAVFEENDRAVLTKELQRRYYSPVIKAIYSVKERYGFSYWRVQTEEGEVKFTLHDTYRSIIRAGERRIIFADVDGNRFEIPNVDELDRKSYKKIDLYL